MTHPDYNSPAELKAFLESNNMAMQKKFGQNFMINPKARTLLIDNLDIQEDDVIWEVGPGLGCMTEALLKSKARSVTAFEIDKGFISLLNAFFGEEKRVGRFSLIEGNVLKTWQEAFSNVSMHPLKLFGNLPYNIAATFIADTISKNCIFNRCVFTVQKEVAERMCAKPNSKAYSAFSVLCQWKYEPRRGQVLSPGNFWPKPTVDSQTIILEAKKSPAKCENPERLVTLVHTLFSSRRKTICNNIKPLLHADVRAEDIFLKTGIDKQKRAENLSVEDFIQLSQSLDSAILTL